MKAALTDEFFPFHLPSQISTEHDTIIKSRKMRGSGQAPCMTDMRNTWHSDISTVLTGLAMMKYGLI
jgi:hypothetical protein